MQIGWLFKLFLSSFLFFSFFFFRKILYIIHCSLSSFRLFALSDRYPPQSIPAMQDWLVPTTA